MAFIFNVDGWIEAGWAMYFYTVPISIILLVIGAIHLVFTTFSKPKAGD